MEYKSIEVKNLKHFNIRDIRADVVNRIDERIKADGFNPAHPLSVVHNDDGYYVLDGNHRLEALNKHSIESVPCVVYPVESDAYKIAVRCNQDEDTYAPMDMFDWLGVIQKQKESGKTQAEIGESIGWSQQKVADYYKTTTHITADVLKMAKEHQSGRAVENTATAVNFTEGWFRNSGLYELEPERQEQFMKWFLDGKAKGGNQQKEKINALKEAQEQIHIIDETLSPEIEEEQKRGLIEAVERGEYTTERLKEVINKLNSQTKNKALFGVDCMEELKKIPDGTVDCIITDPPWGVNFQSARENGNPGFDTGIEETKKLLMDVFAELKRVAKNNAHVYVFYPTTYHCEFQNIIKQFFDLAPVPLIWVKNNHAPCDFKTKYASKYETIFFARGENGKARELNNPCSPNVLNFALPVDRWHDCQKPGDLLTYLISNSTAPHETILDPFMGSGSTMLAAKKANRHYIGFELNAAYESRFKREIGDNK